MEPKDAERIFELCLKLLERIPNKGEEIVKIIYIHWPWNFHCNGGLKESPSFTKAEHQVWKRTVGEKRETDNLFRSIAQAEREAQQAEEPALQPEGEVKQTIEQADRRAQQAEERAFQAEEESERRIRELDDHHKEREEGSSKKRKFDENCSSSEDAHFKNFAKSIKETMKNMRIQLARGKLKTGTLQDLYDTACGKITELEQELADRDKTIETLYETHRQLGVRLEDLHHYMLQEEATEVDIDIARDEELIEWTRQHRRLAQE
jgi:hypothetical protein